MTFGNDSQYPSGNAKRKTPFFEVFVGDQFAKPQDMIELPYQVRKLIEKIEILRTFDGCLFNDTITITFAEASREPYPISDEISADLYASPGTKSTLTNRPGLLPDLHFDKGGTGITALFDTAANLVSQVSSITDTASSLVPLDGLAETPKLTIEKPTEKLDLKYLFQEGNRIRVDWGYVEEIDEGKVRSAISKITVIQTEFPENGSPTTTITCCSLESIWERISTPLGVNFSKKIPTGVDTNSGQLMLRNEDITTKDLIEKICSDAGITAIVSKDLEADILNKDNVKKWIGGESLYQFIGQLATRHNCFFTIYIDPHTGNETLAFIRRSEFETISTISDKNQFVYKADGSIIKSISIKVDFGGITGSGKAGVNRNGELKGSIVEGSKYTVLFDGQKLVAQNPSSTDPTAKKTSKSTAKGGTSTGKVEIHPEVDSDANLPALTASSAHCQSKLVAMDFVTLGNIEIEPGQTIHFQNIGDRYSGHYNVLSVVHVLETGSYICRGTAKSNSLSGGVGVDASQSIPAQDKDFLVGKQLFDKAPKSISDVTSGANTTKKDYDKTR